MTIHNYVYCLLYLCSIFSEAWKNACEESVAKCIQVFGVYFLIYDCYFDWPSSFLLFQVLCNSITTRFFAHDLVQVREMDCLENELRTILIGKNMRNRPRVMSRTNGRIYLTWRIWRQQKKKKKIFLFRVHDFSHTQSGQVP